MQLDFHFSVTYLMARMAEFSPEDAYTIAYSAQQVDDAISDIKIMFDNGAAYMPISSAHKTLDHRNFVAVNNHAVWIPFHFLPGNDNQPQGQGKNQDFVSRIICKQNSPVAMDMISQCIREKGKENGLYRLGITMHVYADTWAHQGFCGISSEVNKVDYFVGDSQSDNLKKQLKTCFGNIFDHIKGKFVDDHLPLGHGAVLTYPDLPYLQWKYKNYAGAEVNRDNPADFVDAAESIYKAMQRYRLGNAQAAVASFTSEFKEMLLARFVAINDEDPEKRNNKWLKMFKDGDWGFRADIAYDEDLWRKGALKKSEKLFPNPYLYSDKFMTSPWKLFNDALKDHYYFINSNLLYAYGICAA